MPVFDLTGDPDPEVTFYKDGNPILVKKNPKCHIAWDPPSDSYTLVIRNAGPEDAGQYTARAVNENGDISCGAKITVGKGEPFAQLTVIDVLTGESSSETEHECGKSNKKRLAEMLEAEPDLSLIREHAESSSSEEENYAPRIEIVPEPVTVKEGETIRLATKVTGQRSYCYIALIKHSFSDQVPT